MKGGEVPPQNSDHPLLRVLAVGDVQKNIGVREKVRVHLEERPAFQNEGGQHDLRQVHPDPDLRQQVGDDGPVALHVDVFFVGLVALVQRVVVDVGVEGRVKVNGVSGRINVSYTRKYFCRGLVNTNKGSVLPNIVLFRPPHIATKGILFIDGCYNS